MHETFMVLPNGHAVPLAAYEAIVKHINSVIPVLPYGVDLTLKEICGPAFWDALTKGEPSRVGRIVARLVSHGDFDLDPVGCKHQLPKRYRRR